MTTSCATTITSTGTTTVIRSPSGTPLYQWPAGWRLVPPPEVCDNCGKPADGLLSWHDKMGRLQDFAGCVACAKSRRAQIEATGIKPRAARLNEDI